MATINLFAQLMTRARRHQRCGRYLSAVTILRRLCSFPDAPVALAASALERIGRVWLRRRRYGRARRALSRALRLRPETARLHHLLGLAWDRDPEGSVERASQHYQESLRLDPLQPLCLADAGLHAAKRGEEALALRLLRDAYYQAPTCPRVTRRLVRGLLRLGRPGEALQAAREAMFRSPRDTRMRKVHSDLRATLARREQELAAIEEAREQTPVVLPFVRVVSERLDSPCPMREDEPSALAGPHLVRLRVRQGRRRAP